jgi:hypothetical protein
MLPCHLFIYLELAAGLCLPCRMSQRLHTATQRLHCTELLVTWYIGSRLSTSEAFISFYDDKQIIITYSLHILELLNHH